MIDHWMKTLLRLQTLIVCFWSTKKGTLVQVLMCLGSCAVYTLLSIILLFTSYWLSFTLQKSFCFPEAEVVLSISSHSLAITTSYFRDRNTHFPKCFSSFSALSLRIDKKSERQVHYWKPMPPFSSFCYHQNRYIFSS